MSGNLSIESFNCHGFNGCKPFLCDILCKCDILCLQELMISKQDCHVLNSCHRVYLGYGVSPVDASLGVLLGRPYGGVGFLWKRAIDEYVTIIDCDYDWLCCIKVSNNSNDFYLLNVYMPYECEDNRDVYNDYMSTSVAFCNGINSTCIFIVGDFNAKTSVFGTILQDFCNDFFFLDCCRDLYVCELCMGDDLLGWPCNMHCWCQRLRHGYDGVVWLYLFRSPPATV